MADILRKEMADIWTTQVNDYGLWDHKINKVGEHNVPAICERKVPNGDEWMRYIWKQQCAELFTPGFLSTSLQIADTSVLRCNMAVWSCTLKKLPCCVAIFHIHNLSLWYMIHPTAGIEVHSEFLLWTQQSDSAEHILTEPSLHR